MPKLGRPCLGGGLAPTTQAGAARSEVKCPARRIGQAAPVLHAIGADALNISLAFKCAGRALPSSAPATRSAG
jgi:hypothetical protein